jgi:hypothetical protein
MAWPKSVLRFRARRPASRRARRQADDFSPTQPAPFDELVRLQARSRALAIVGGVKHSKQFYEAIDRFTIEGTRSIVVRAYGLRADRHAEVLPARMTVEFWEGIARGRKSLAR